MKIRLTALMLILTLGILSGCAVSALQPEATVPSPAVTSVAPAAAPAEPAAVPAEPAPAPIPPAPAEAASPYLSREEAIAIALKAASLAENQVTRLKTEFDYDDGIPEYDVEFTHGGWEYEYEIHAESGNILRSDKDWDN